MNVRLKQRTRTCFRTTPSHVVLHRCVRRGRRTSARNGTGNKSHASHIGHQCIRHKTNGVRRPGLICAISALFARPLHFTRAHIHTHTNTLCHRRHLYPVSLSSHHVFTASRARYATYIYICWREQRLCVHDCVQHDPVRRGVRACMCVIRKHAHTRNTRFAHTNRKSSGRKHTATTLLRNRTAHLPFIWIY